MEKTRKIRQQGFVNFPIEDTENWIDSSEGGLYVELVVVENDIKYQDSYNFENEWRECHGGGCFTVMQESFINDDRGTRKDDDGYMEKDELQNFHYPRYSAYKSLVGENNKGTYPDWMSIDYLCSILIGSTNWSGFSDLMVTYWHCTYDDLTIEGKALYNTIKKLYEGHDLILLTSLDT